MDINFGESPLIENPNQVYHDRTLFGKGTRRSPLKVSAAAAAGVADGDYGDIVVSGSGTT